MGYTTRFNGSLKLNAALTTGQAAELRAFSKDPHQFCDHNHHVSAALPGTWCDWIPSPSGEALVWNGAEKFYSYVEWANYILDHFLSRWGIHYAASDVTYRGEDFVDTGRLVINERGRVERLPENEGHGGGVW